MLDCLVNNIYFDEIALSFTRMQSECQNFVASLKQAGVDMDAHVQPGWAIARILMMTHLCFIQLQVYLYLGTSSGLVHHCLSCCEASAEGQSAGDL